MIFSENRLPPSDQVRGQAFSGSSSGSRRDVEAWLTTSKQILFRGGALIEQRAPIRAFGAVPSRGYTVHAD
jgi:hypothetical protein